VLLAGGAKYPLTGRSLVTLVLRREQRRRRIDERSPNGVEQANGDEAVTADTDREAEVARGAADADTPAAAPEQVEHADVVRPSR
jgi:hypothetical protein